MNSTRSFRSAALSLALAFAACGWTFFALQARLFADDAADEIVSDVAECLKPTKSFSVLSKIDTYRNRAAAGSMTLRTYVRIADSDAGPHSVSIVLFPEGERGKVFLRIGEALWLYDPGADRPVQVSTQQRLMGDASLADVTHFDLEENYSAVLEGEETVLDPSGDSVSTQRLTLTAQTKNVLYPTLRLWASGSGDRPVKIECLSSADRVLKTVFYGRFRGFLGKSRPTELTVVDGTAPGRVTRIRFSEFLYQDLQKEAYAPEAMPSVSKFTESDSAVK